MTKLANLDVLNQSAPFEDVNLYSTDHVLQAAVIREGGGSSQERLLGIGAEFGSAQSLEHGRLANEHPPRLRTHGRIGGRIDQVVYHPSYHACMKMSVREGLHCAGWDHLGRDQAAPIKGAQVARGAAFYMAAQMEPGHCCPITMTHASVPVLVQNKEISDVWLPKILSRDYDARFTPVEEKNSTLIGMGMTEKQGGSDVRANTTLAQAISIKDGEYILNGHKWFLSAPMSDAFLMLAQAKGGLSCFFVPRILPDGSVNGLHFQRLKDKLGNRSNASSEVEINNAHGWIINEEGRGIATILEMVTQTRLDCALSSAGLMRFTLANAIHHARYRKVFGKLLIRQPLMQHVLCDLAVEVEAATVLAFRLARAFDHSDDAHEAAWSRMMTPVTKYWTTKIAPGFVCEAMECMGGNGYIEEFPFARAYREAPVNAIWEGSGNIMALDVLRVFKHEPDTLGLVMVKLLAGAREDKSLVAAHQRIEKMLKDGSLLENRARAIVEGLALLAAGVLLRQHASRSVADAFIETRFGGGPRQTYGQGLECADAASIVDAALPH